MNWAICCCEFILSDTKNLETVSHWMEMLWDLVNDIPCLEWHFTSLLRELSSECLHNTRNFFGAKEGCMKNLEFEFKWRIPMKNSNEEFEWRISNLFRWMKFWWKFWDSVNDIPCLEWHFTSLEFTLVNSNCYCYHFTLLSC